MLKSEIQPGTDYALREKREIGAPFQRVRIIEHIRKHKWKAKWIEPNPGLIDARITFRSGTETFKGTRCVVPA